ncbi:MAG TPA: polysaccharide deacetylase family protein [Xanthobacteraceae bacterium]|nr:polysaccharide deacetylase family protein [Xanthobacteraceae bacterium]
MANLPVLRSILPCNAFIVMLHEIQIDHNAELMTGTSKDLFARCLQWLHSNGWEFTSLDDCLTMLASGDRSRRCVVLTFDDGYRDLASSALPLLERFGAPFVTYVPTAALQRTLPCWWLGLRELLRSRERLVLESVGRSFVCPDRQSKLKALLTISSWVHRDYRRAALLGAELESAGISFAALNEAYFFSQDELRALAQHPLASIGSHTVTHRALASLDEADARQEIADNRAYLEGLVDRPVQLFCYPYGTTRSFGPRDERIVGELGFTSAVCGRKDRLDGSLSRFSLPRIAMGGPFGTAASFAANVEAIDLIARPLRACEKMRALWASWIDEGKAGGRPINSRQSPKVLVSERIPHRLLGDFADRQR